MLKPYSRTWTCVFALSAVNHVAAQWPADANTLIIKEMEHLYLDSAPSGMINGVTPCTTYIDPTTGGTNNNLGRQQAAEWIRTTFHDFVTADIYTETGGVDASIGFETGRDENVGPAFNDALTFFSYFYSALVSMSDLIALGTVLAVGNCGGPHIELRAGRIDATAAGPSGVPKPETSLQDTLTDFSNAGFNQDDTITLTACGHSMGGVHRSSFPQVVGPNAGGTTGTDGRQPFDETVAIFDVDTVSDYVQSTGLKGGPLVTTPNVTVQSDLRLYSSDSNQTVDRLSQSASYFEGQCQGIFQRMIETVPSNVQFTAAVDPTTSNYLRPADMYLNVDWKGSMTLTGFFRYVQVAGVAAAPATLTITLIGRNGKTSTYTATATASAQDTGTGIWGPTRAFPFTLTFPAATGLGGLSVSGQTFTFQDSMFVVSGLSSVTPKPPTFTTTPAMNAQASYSANITVAYLTTSPPASLTATCHIPVPQTGSVSPTIDSSTTASLKLVGTTGPFAIYSAIITKTVTAKQGYGSSVDIAVPGSSPGVLNFKPFISAE